MEHILTCILKHVLKRPILHVTDSETPSRTSNELVFLNAFETLDCVIDSVSTYTLTIGTLRFYDAAIYNATGSEFVGSEVSMRARSCLRNLIYDDVVLPFSRRRKFPTKTTLKMATISANELQEKEGTKSG